MSISKDFAAKKYLEYLEYARKWREKNKDYHKQWREQRKPFRYRCKLCDVSFDKYNKKKHKEGYNHLVKSIAKRVSWLQHPDRTTYSRAVIIRYLKKQLNIIQKVEKKLKSNNN